MLGVDDYGSDSDDDTQAQVPQAPPKPAPAKPTPAKKFGLSLPAPSGSTSASKSSGLSLPEPKKKAPKKIAIGLPTLTPAGDDDDDALDDRPPAKRPRMDLGAGGGGRASALLSMLPAPKNKNKNPVPAAAPQERVLGGGRGQALNFSTGVKAAPQRATVEDEDEAEDEDAAPTNTTPLSGAILEEIEPLKPKAASALPFLPPSLAKGKANINTEDRPSISRAAAHKAAATPAVDFFSLGSSSSSSSSLPSTTAIASSSKSSVLPTVSSAPKVDEFAPPEPTQTDPYPGYYQLPSGAWAAYDPAYYKKFYDRWKKQYDAHVRALEKGIEKGFEGAEQEGAEEVNALAEMEKAKVEIQEREEKKALTQGAGAVPAAPKMNIKGAALSGRARTRHQLSTLLTEAYTNREVLEEKIAMAKRNRKEAGNKYGF